MRRILMHPRRREIVEWISIKDKHPEEGQSVLTYHHGYMDVAEIMWFDDDNIPHFIAGSGSYIAEYWMPLPEPPRE
ncbi:Domain of unknown function DUF551 [uncultured Caudovirales phage]|jgi:hypothetical protein|uniref:DUF551 domain-containing protein n=1 Tax=uncultured Caudovirales phage TaxID=2100421 RepID=A0A6J5KVV6_9CAUD|nr:Domain of unknown function DUF551 [uncultured Caudovirales phage]